MKYVVATLQQQQNEKIGLHLNVKSHKNESHTCTYAWKTYTVYRPVSYTHLDVYKRQLYSSTKIN